MRSRLAVRAVLAAVASAAALTAVATGTASAHTGKSATSRPSRVAPAAAPASVAASAARCHTADLSFSVAPGSGAQSVGSQGPVIIDMTNNGPSSCTMNGYPGVDLVAGDGQTWSLVRQTSVAPHAVTVRPGASTSFVITYLPYTPGSGQAFDVKTIVITPPNETTSVRIPWEFQPVLLQDGATHPGTYVGPVGAE